MTPLARMTPATLDVLRVLLDDGASVWGMLVIKRTDRPAGSVYPILERLEGAGWLASEWETETERKGPRRRLYRLTSDGAEAARAAIARVEAPARTAPKTPRPIRASKSAQRPARLTTAGASA